MQASYLENGYDNRPIWLAILRNVALLTPVDRKHRTSIRRGLFAACCKHSMGIEGFMKLTWLILNYAANTTG